MLRVFALVGWMPIPIEVAAWHSLWTRERARQTGRPPSVRHAIFDFRIGFIDATALACAFVLLGALLVLHQAGAAFTRLIDFATTLSFLSAPLLAWITLRAVTGPHVPAAARPGQGLLWLAWTSLAFGVAFSVAWLLWLLFG